MKSWKLVLIALIGAFTLSSSSACTVTSDDDDNIGDDDDFSDDDDDGDSGTGGFPGTGGTGGTGGGISGTGGTGGTGGSGGGILTGRSVAEDYVALYEDQAYGDNCLACLETQCVDEIDACGGAVNTNCVDSMECVYDAIQEQQRSELVIECAFDSCSDVLIAEPAGETSNFAACLSTRCFESCGVDTSQAPTCN